MDNTKELTVVEWFTGYGGNELGLRRVIPTMRPIAFCERDAFVVANLVAKMEAGLLDPVPVWSDVTTFPIEPFKNRVGLFIASYPCQPFSHAGKRDGKDDCRHLWPSCRRFICGAHPDMVFLENVEGHVSLGLSTVLADLEEDGYTAAWGIFSASEVGAPHQRKRVFILAYDKSNRRPAWGTESKGHLGESGSDISDVAGEDVAHQQQQGLQGHAGDVHGEGREPGGEDRPATEESLCGDVWPSRPGASQYGWEPPRVVGNANGGGGTSNSSITGSIGQEKGRGKNESHSASECRGQTQPPLGGNADGPANGLDFPRLSNLSDSELEQVYGWMVKGTNRTDELRMCGNGVVPQTAEKAFRCLYAELFGAGSLVMEDL